MTSAQDLFNCLGDLEAFGEKILSVKKNEEYVIKHTPHAGQKRLIEAHAPIVLCTAGNAAGKTWALTIKHIYYCVFKIGLEHLITENPAKWLAAQYNTLNCSYEYKISTRVFDLINKLYINNPLFKNLLIKDIRQSDNRITWFNGAETHCISLDEGGKHIEGERYRLITVDELGYKFSPDLQDIYYSVLIPRTMGADGIVTLVGTPKEAQSPWINELHERSKKEKDIIYIQMPTIENTYIPKSEIKQREAMTKDFPIWHRMVFYGELIPTAGNSLTARQIENAIDYNLPCDGRNREAKPSKSPLMFGTQDKIEGHKYVSFWDIAMQTDWSVGITLDVTTIPFSVVNYTRVNRSNIKGWSELFDLMVREYKRYGSTQHYDSTGQIGGKLKEDLRKIAFDQDLPSNFSRAKMILGDKGKMKPDSIGKEELINCLTLAFAYKEPVDEKDLTIWGKVRIPNIKQLIKELQQYHPDDKKIKETDSVIALAGALAVAPDPDSGYQAGFIGNNPRGEREYIYLEG